MLGRLRRLGRGLVQGTKDVAGGLYRQDCLGLSAQVAYSALFSLFPFLLIVNGVVGLIPGGQEQVRRWLLDGLSGLVGTGSRLYEIVEDNVFSEVGALSATLLSIGVILTLWSASSAVMVLLKAVNRAYGLEETRSWQKRRAMAVGWAIAGAVVIPAGVLLLVFGSWIGNRIGDSMGYGSSLHTLWVGLRWPVVLILLVAALGVFFYFAPAKRQKWYSVLPGAAVSVAGITGASVGLSWFVSQSILQVRWLTYGAIGTVIVLVFWAFVIAFMVLAGGQINAVIHQAVLAKREVASELVESADDE
jgi:membrane protein